MSLMQDVARGKPGVRAEPRPSRFRQETLPMLLCALVAAVCFINTLTNDFCYDDHAIIVENPW